MSLYRFLGKVIFKPQYNQFIKFSKEPQSAQNKAWERIRKQLSQGTFWALRHKDFSQSSLKDFAITEYDDYRQVLFDHYDSKNSPFTGEPIKFWSESSGTTGLPKIYPITNSYQKEFQMVNGPFLYQVLRNNPTFLENKTLYFAATHPSKKTKVGIDVGFISAFNYAHIPALFKRKYAFPDAVFENRDVFFLWGVLYAMSAKVDTFVAITPSIIERFYQQIKNQREFYKEQIHKPQPPAGFPRLRFPDSEKKRLLQVLEQDSFTLKDLWPNLSTLICWTSSTCRLQLQNIKPILGSIRVIEALYAATEGWANVPFGDEQSGGVLHCGGHVYEFLEVGQEVLPKNLLKPWELKTGKYYEIFLTTSMGFIRFRLRDIMYCKGFFHDAPIIEFFEKEGQSISIGHTRVSDVHILKSIEAFKITMPSKWFVICATDGKSLVLVLPEGNQFSEAQLKALDQGLCSATEEYDDDRKEGLLLQIAKKTLPSDHIFWSQTQHAQSKPKLVLQGSISLQR